MSTSDQSAQTSKKLLAQAATLSVSMALVTLAGLAAFVSAAEAARSLYITNVGNRNVTALTIAPNGVPKPIAGSPYGTGITPVGLAITPDAEHLYVANLESANLSAFTIAPNGGLSPVPGSPFSTRAGPWGVAVSPDGEHLYVANSSADTVSGYAIAADGSLSPVPGSPFPTGSKPGSTANGVAVTPDGEHLYVTNMNGGGNVVAFSIAADGSLSPVAGSPFDSGATARPVVVSPDGSHLYVGTSDNNIWGYSIGSDGALAPIASSPVFTEGQSLGLAIAPEGAHLYGAHVGGDDNVWGYEIGSEGGLAPLSGAPFPTGGWRGNSVVVSPDDEHLYATNNGTRDLSVYTIAADGNLSPIAGSPLALGGSPLQMAMTPDQGPVAAFSASPTPAGNPLSLDASASSDSDGTVADYHWDFGDGQTEVTSTPKVAHVYESAGDYSVTLTVTDNSGCSTTQTFTGQTVSCNGSPAAQVSHRIMVPPGEPLSIALSGFGSVTSSPAGIDCPGTCSYAFEPGTEVTLTPAPAPGSAFAGWKGGGCAGTGTCRVTVNAESEVIAAFDKTPPPPPLGGPAPEELAEAGLRIGRVREAPRAGCGTVLRFLRGLLESPCARPRIMVRGGIAKAAGGAVWVKAVVYLHGRQIRVSRWVRIRDGRWSARLPLPWVEEKSEATVSITAWFEGSPGVQGDYAKRRVRVLSST